MAGWLPSSHFCSNILQNRRAERRARVTSKSGTPVSRESVPISSSMVPPPAVDVMVLSLAATLTTRSILL